MLKDHFIHLLKYNDWATHETSNSIKGLEKKDERIIDLLSHILSAQKVWLNRVLERDILVSPWERHKVKDVTIESTDVTADWINLLESYSDKELDKRVEYKNTQGEKFLNTIKDIVAHLINHSTYHRGLKTLVGNLPLRIT